MNNLLMGLEYCNSYCFDLTISLADTLKIVGAALAFGFTFYQYRKGQQWKRTEFIISLIKEFKENFNVTRATLMLDWNIVNIPLNEKEILKLGKNELFFTDDLLKSSLRNHFKFKPGEGFSEEEFIVRLILDDFLDRLGQFNQFIDNKIIKPKDLRIYLNYWIKIIGDTNNKSKDKSVRVLLWNYIVTYQFTDVIDLFKRYNYNIKLD